MDDSSGTTSLGEGFGPPGPTIGEASSESIPLTGTPLQQEVTEILHGQLQNFLGDIEFRLAQTRQIEARVMAALEQIAGLDPEEYRIKIVGNGSIYAEDINISRHQITGYVVTSNSPGAGSIAWSSLHVVYNGVDYTMANSSTALKYAWFDAAVSTTALQTSNTKPTLTGNSALIFFNDAGIAREILNASIPPVVGNSSIDSAAIQAGAVTQTAILDGAVSPAKTSFYPTLAAAVTAAQSAADLAQATADGAITTYFQSAPPWANGTTQPVAVVGDVWYDSDDGQAYRWSGASGTPPNTFVAISDSDIGAALAAANLAQTTANSKITTFYANNSAPPTALAIGDLWVVIDQGNLIRRAASTGTGGWVDLTIGTGAIGTNAVTDAKIATGVSGAKLVSGSVSATQLGAGAVTPVKLNVLQHVLY